MMRPRELPSTACNSQCQTMTSGFSSNNNLPEMIMQPITIEREIIEIEDDECKKGDF
jgi:hypothetical protein